MPQFQLDLSLGYVLNRAAGRMKRAFDRRLAEHGLTTSQWSIMACIAGEEGVGGSFAVRSTHNDRNSDAPGRTRNHRAATVAHRFTSAGDLFFCQRSNTFCAAAFDGGCGQCHCDDEPIGI